MKLLIHAVDIHVPKFYVHAIGMMMLMPIVARFACTVHLQCTVYMHVYIYIYIYSCTT